MKLAPIYDINQINKIMLDLSVVDDISDDYSKGCAIHTLPENFEFMAIYDLGQLQGFYVITPLNAVTAEIHTCLLPTIRGKKAILAGTLLLNCLFSRYLKAISWVPEINRKALIYAIRLGFSVEGINKKSFFKNSCLIDQKLVGLTREEWLCQ